jgi:lipopolysaccharide/colanic/teichoic acid biosynthesis glycosyltransferase
LVSAEEVRSNRSAEHSINHEEFVMAGVVLEQIPDQLQAVTPTFGQKRLYFLCKRCVDIVASAFLLVVAAPVVLLIALLIKLDSPGPVLFRQERLALRKRSKGQEEWQLEPFVMYKFRTMRSHSAPGVHQQFMKALIQGDEQDLVRLRHENGAVVNKLSGDRRITRVGKPLRRANLDELPQLWNVLKGDMSLVGPRPPLAYEVAEYKPQHWKRLATIPGCVGLWQVRGWNTLTFEQMVRLDVWYVDHQSLWLDLRIVLETAAAVLSGKGGG